jgi:iron complex transport system substrate-binding protein
VAFLAIALWHLLGRGDPLPPRAAGGLRIVSRAPSITEILFALDLEDSVVGVTRFCDYPPAARKLPRTGGFVDPTFEAIVGLQPDLAILLDSGDREADEQRLEALGIDRLVVSNKSVDGILEAITMIGQRCGAVGVAEELVEELQARMAEVRARTAGRPRPRVLVAIGGHTGSRDFSEVYVAGRESFYEEIVDLAGGENACCQGRAQFPMMTIEGILHLDPDVVVDLVPDLQKRGWDGEAIRRDWLEMFGDSSERERRVFVFGQDFVVRPGPRFILLVEELARRLHPDSEWAVR